jgi:hypothetical protein
MFRIMGGRCNPPPPKPPPPGRHVPVCSFKCLKLPGIFEGIHSTTDADYFLEVSQRNLVTLWRRQGDKRIANLFTKGGVITGISL